MLAAGRLRHQITIEHPVESQDAAGEPVKSWAPIPNGITWAEKLDLTGRELFQAQQTSGEVTTQFTLRHRTDVDARMRVVSCDELYSIEAPLDPDGRRERTILLCSRDVN